jgi:hypothetical protein
MFEREEAGGKLLGYSLNVEHVFFFFGAKTLNRERLCAAFPQYELCFIKQVHGRTVVSADPRGEVEADGHLTTMATRAPVVQSADCVPILLASKNRVCALHAGWRGVAQNIVAAAAAHLRDEPMLFAAIGPHIGAASFEIGRDVAAQLQAAAPGVDFITAHPSAPDKVFADLSKIVRAQLANAFGSKVKIFECAIDTKTSADFCSFRRDGAQAGRQYSFVVLNS